MRKSNAQLLDEYLEKGGKVKLFPVSKNYRLLSFNSRFNNSDTTAGGFRASERKTRAIKRWVKKEAIKAQEKRNTQF